MYIYMWLPSCNILSENRSSLLLHQFLVYLFIFVYMVSELAFCVRFLCELPFPSSFWNRHLNSAIQLLKSDPKLCHQHLYLDFCQNRSIKRSPIVSPPLPSNSDTSGDQTPRRRPLQDGWRALTRRRPSATRRPRAAREAYSGHRRLRAFEVLLVFSFWIRFRCSFGPIPLLVLFDFVSSR